jgi:hypothetical protein
MRDNPPLHWTAATERLLSSFASRIRLIKRSRYKRHHYNNSEVPARTLVLHRLAVHRDWGAIVLIAILLTTDTFRSNTTVSRWRDLVWLAWLAVPLYLLHQFEEYSLPTLGLDYSIQNMIAQKLGYPPYPDCPIPLAFYPVVNIALMWFGSPLAAYLSRRNVLSASAFGD